ERAGGVRRDVLEKDLAAGAGAAFAVAVSGGEHLAERALPGGLGDEEVDEAGTGDLGLREDAAAVADAAGELLRDFPRFSAGAAGEHERRVGRIVAVRLLLGP